MKNYQNLWQNSKIAAVPVKFAADAICASAPFLMSARPTLLGKPSLEKKLILGLRPKKGGFRPIPTSLTDFWAEIGLLFSVKAGQKINFFSSDGFP